MSDAQYTVAQDEKRGSASRAKIKKLSKILVFLVVVFFLENSNIEKMKKIEKYL